jgi:predicted Zn finger-like uncharacterized protein
MALATTCPQCKTSFKVVPDQLKLRRGLVRCGVCQHVFSGIDYLRYVDDAARAAHRAARAAADGTAAAGGAPAGPAAPGRAADAMPPDAAPGRASDARPSPHASGRTADTLPPTHPAGRTADAAPAPQAPGRTADAAPAPQAPGRTADAAPAPQAPGRTADAAPAPRAPGRTADAPPQAPGRAADAAPAPHAPRRVADSPPTPSAPGRTAAPWPPLPGTAPGTSGPPSASPAAAQWAALEAPRGAAGAPATAARGSTPTGRGPGEPPTPPHIDPWAAAAAAAHERSLRDDALPTAPAIRGTGLPQPGRAGGFAAAPLGERGAPPPGLPGLPSPPGAGLPGPSGPPGPPATGRGGPDTVTGGQPSLPWPIAASGPQTLIGPDDDLKTAFFLTDSGFGPFPGEQTDVMPPTSIHRPGSQVEPTTFIRGELGPVTPPSGVTLRPETPFPPATADPPPARRAPGPMTVTLRAADAATGPSPLAEPIAGPGLPSATAPAPSAATAAARLAAEPAIDYFSTGRRRERGLGLALSPAAWVGAIGLSLLLAGQAVVGWRDTIAARAPALAPALAAVLSPFGLAIAPPRDLSALTIESFELQSAGAPNVLRMSAVLRNRSGHAVGFPAMELSLTDSAGGLIVRKVIPAETYLGAAPVGARGLQARSEWPLRLALEHGGSPPTGYSVALFYP